MHQPGDQIDIWVVEKALGSGGMGSVYRCRNKAASRILAAVKVLESGLRRHPEAEARFIREAEILFQLDHPNIVKVRNIRTDVDPPYLEMEFVEGESLEDRLKRGALPIDLAVSLMEQCASALAYLHGQGVRHRDIKPANLVIQTGGTVKLVDFGLAVEMDATRITQQGMAFGTVSYAPPEWIAPDRLDASLWDIYALGVVFHEMLTGQIAFPVSGQGSARQQAMQVIVGKQSHPPLDPGTRFQDDVRALIRDMTQGDATRRVATATEVLERARALDGHLREEGGATIAPTELDPALKDLITPTDASSTGDTWAETGPQPLMPSDPTPLRRRRAGLAAVVAIVAAAGGSVVLAVVIAIAVIAAFQPPATVDVVVMVTGVERGVPVDLRLGEAEASDVTFPRWSFREQPRGPVDVRWAAGAPGCSTASCPGEECPVWCTTGSVTREISGRGSSELDLEVQAPQPRDLALSLPALQGDVEVAATLGEVRGERTDDGVVFASVAPSLLQLRIVAGTCDDDAIGCWPDGECPDGCASYLAEIAVPAEADLDVDPIELPSPRTDGARRPAPVVAPQPATPVAPSPTPPPSGPQPPVRCAAFSKWLAANPKWIRGGELAGADPAYLAGWDGATPPAGAEGNAITGASFGAARAYCRERGGLLEVDDEPLEWQGAPTLEWRVNPDSPGRPAARTSDGTRLVQGNLGSPGLTGFRCRR